MRPLTGIAAAALAGLAVAGQDPAEVYLFRSTSQVESSADASPRIPKEIARQIILQRTSRDRYGSPLRDIPNTVDEDAAIAYINTFGRSRSPILGSAEQTLEPAQLVVLLEGITAENVEPLRRALSKSSTQQPAFVIPQPPSVKANDGLFADLRAEGVASKKTCQIEGAINPNDQSCWDGLSNVVRYDAKKSPETIASLANSIDRLSRFVSSGELEALLILLPESSRSSKLASWSASRPSSPSAELRRRDDSELVISDGPAAAPAATSTSTPATPADAAFWAANQDKGAAARIPACFPSFNSCEARTNRCSGGHGVCVDRYGNDSKAACFACHCVSTVVLAGDEPGAVGEKTVRWAGRACQKKDVSVPFWLLAGFSVAIVGVVTFAVGLLYSIGEEKLPGVIGAGVSRSK